MADRQLIQVMSENGDGTGATSLKVNGSVTPALRKVTIPSWGGHLAIEKLRIYGEDDATPDADGSFLNLANGPAALTTGLEVGIYDSGDNLVVDLMGGLGVAKNNSDFISTGWDWVYQTFSAGDSALYVERVFRRPLIIQGGRYLGVKVQDDLTAFTTALASILGIVE